MRIVWLGVMGVAVGCFTPPPPEETRPAANAERLRFECEANGLRAYDPSRSLLVGPKMNCTVQVADRGGVVVAGAPVTFLTEAGRLLSSGPTDASGVRVAIHEVAEPLPRDVEPGVFIARPGEPFAPPFMKPERWGQDPRIEPMPGTATGIEPRRPDPIRRGPNGPLVNNPRDNLVTLVAVVEGEEAFVDSNGNGAFDPGEPFTDLAEPFIDANDDATRGDDEDFIDTNGNRQWDGPNGTWDATTRIWRQTRVLWTGLPASSDFQQALPTVPGHRATYVPATARLQCGDANCTTATTTARAFISDPWFNALTHLASTDRCESTDAATPVTIEGAALGPQQTWPAGEYLTFTVTKNANATLTRGAIVDVPVRCRLTATPTGTSADDLLISVGVTVQ